MIYLQMHCNSCSKMVEKEIQIDKALVLEEGKIIYLKKERKHAFVCNDCIDKLEALAGRHVYDITTTSGGICITLLGQSKTNI